MVELIFNAVKVYWSKLSYSVLNTRGCSEEVEGVAISWEFVASRDGFEQMGEITRKYCHVFTLAGNIRALVSPWFSVYAMQIILESKPRYPFVPTTESTCSQMDKNGAKFHWYARSADIRLETRCAGRMLRGLISNNGEAKTYVLVYTPFYTTEKSLMSMRWLDRTQLHCYGCST